MSETILYSEREPAGALDPHVGLTVEYPGGPVTLGQRRNDQLMRNWTLVDHSHVRARGV